MTPPHTLSTPAPATSSSPSSSPSQPEQRNDSRTVMDRRYHLSRTATRLLKAGVIEEFWRVARAPGAHSRAAGYAVKINGEWTRLPGISPMQVFLDSLTP